MSGKSLPRPAEVVGIRPILRRARQSIKRSPWYAAKKKSLFFTDRPADGKPKLIHPYRWLDPVGRVGSWLAKNEFASSASLRKNHHAAPVEVICPGLGDQAGHCAGAPTKFSRVVQREYLHLLNRIHDRSIDNATAQTCVRDTVDQKPPEVFADTIHHCLAAFFKNHTANIDRTRNVLHQVVYIASVQRKVRDLD